MVEDKVYKEIYQELISSGKSLIQLYTEVREERDELIAKLACVRMGIPLDNNEPSWEENDERMDIIGQNGNEGTHYANVKPNFI